MQTFFFQLFPFQLSSLYKCNVFLSSCCKSTFFFIYMQPILCTTSLLQSLLYIATINSVLKSSGPRVPPLFFLIIIINAEISAKFTEELFTGEAGSRIKKGWLPLVSCVSVTRNTKLLFPSCQWISGNLYFATLSSRPLAITIPILVLLPDPHVGGQGRVHRQPWFALRWS